MLRKNHSYVLLLALLAVIACEGTTEPVPTTVEALAGSGQSGSVGAPLPTPLTVRVVDSKGFPVRGLPVTWTAGPNSGTVVAVDAATDRTGIARANWVLGTRAGAQSVTATVGNLPPVTFTATATAGTAARITLARDSFATRNVGDTVRIAATVTDQFGNALTDQAVTFSSANDAIATVSSTGLVTIRGRGTTTITVSRGSVSVPFRVRVTEIARVVVAPPALTFTSLGQSTQLQVRAEDAQGVAFTNIAFTFSSSNTNVATVSSTGLVRPTGPGTAQITVRGDGAQVLVPVSVTQTIGSMTITPPLPSVGVGGTLQLSVDARDAGGAPIQNPVVTWASANPAIATVSGTGLVTGVTRGTVAITAQAGSVVATTELAVTSLLTRIAAGAAHSCAIGTLSPTRTGAPLCWGFGAQGRLGGGSDESSLTPRDVGGNLTLNRIGAGGAHSCGLGTAGEVWCWGFNGFGQLGNNAIIDTNVPVRTSTAVAFTQLTVPSSGSHNCAISDAGAAYCWGANSFGQLGIGANPTTCTGASCAIVPTLVSGGLVFTRIGAGARHTCAVTTATGEVHCWGSNQFGQLGTGTTTSSNVPVRVTSSVVFADVAGGDDFACALAADGRAYCWGRNHAGQLGTGTGTDITTPGLVATALTFVQIDAGAAHACGRTSSGQIWCWGSNIAGQLGNNTTANSLIPVQVQAPGITFTDLDVGAEHSCAVASSGIGYCWGRNTLGQLGNGTTETRLVPTPLR